MQNINLIQNLSEEKNEEKKRADSIKVSCKYLKKVIIFI